MTIGRQVQLSGKRIYKGMRVSFRWSRGALASKLDRSRVGYVVRVPAGTHAGSVSITVSDKAGRRSNIKRISVAAPPRIGGSTPAPGPPGSLPKAFQGNGMWIWELDNTEGGDIAAIAARAHAAGMSTVFVKSSDGASSRWAQFNPGLVQALHANGLQVCAWQFVYGNDPQGEASLGVDAVADGADCLVIDAETQYEGKYAAAQQYVAALRASLGPAYPIGLTSFPYVDYHPRLPYSVFLAPGAAQANLPQVYWKDIGGTVDAVSAHTLAANRIYGVADRPARPDVQQPSGRGSRPVPLALGGLRERRPVVVVVAVVGRRRVGRARPAAGARPRAAPGSGLAGADEGQQGRPGRLAAAAPRVLRPGGDGHEHVRRRHRSRTAQLPDVAQPAGDGHDGRTDVAGRSGPAAAAGQLDDDEEVGAAGESPILPQKFSRPHEKCHRADS